MHSPSGALYLAFPKPLWLWPGTASQLLLVGLGRAAGLVPCAEGTGVALGGEDHRGWLAWLAEAPGTLCAEP